MSEPFIGEIRAFTYTFAPYGWAFCNGALLNVQQNQALYATIGNKFGGDTTNFNIPDLRNKAVMGFGKGKSIQNNYEFSKVFGENSHTLNANETPAHNHTVNAGTTQANLTTPENNYWGITRYTPSGGSEKTANSYATVPSPPDTLNQNFVSQAGANSAHENRQPYVTCSFCIAVEGVFPVRP